MRNFRFRYRQSGGHVHVRVFSAYRRYLTHTKLGDLWFDYKEWPLFIDCLKAHGDVTIEVVPDLPESRL